MSEMGERIARMEQGGIDVLRRLESVEIGQVTILAEISSIRATLERRQVALRIGGHVRDLCKMVLAAIAGAVAAGWHWHGP